MKYEKEVYSGLKKASNKSKRDGKWATPPEVRSFTVGLPMSSPCKPILMQLVKENRAEKKKAKELYRPTGAGGGGFGNPFSDGYRSPDGYRYPDESPRGGDTRGDSPTPTTPRTEDTVRTAVGTMIVGGTLAGVPTTGTGGTVPTLR